MGKVKAAAGGLAAYEIAKHTKHHHDKKHHCDCKDCKKHHH